MPHARLILRDNQAHEQPLTTTSRRSKSLRHFKQHRRERRSEQPTPSICTRLTAASLNAPACVQPGMTPFGRGLVSSEQMPSGKRLLSVPFSQLLLLPEKVDGPFEKVHHRFLKEHGSLPKDLLRFITGTARWDLRLTAWLLWLSKHGSVFWKQYTASLPQEAEMTCLLNYTPEEQSELQWLANEAAVQHSWAEDSHESVFSSQTGHLKALQLADRLQDTLWAMSLVRSRTFSDTASLCNDRHGKWHHCTRELHDMLPWIDPGGSIQVHETELALMVPNADLANHAFQHNATYALKTAKGSFELTSCRPISAGDAACISYGADKTNAELMRDYGFYVPGNLNDRLDFAASSWEQHAGIIAKPATLLFKALNVSPAPLREEERPKLLAGPLLTALGLQGKLEAGKVCVQGMTSQESAEACDQDAGMSRTLAAVLSLPTQDSSSVEDETCRASSFWPPRSWTDSGEPALKIILTPKERRQQRQAADMLQQHCKSLQAWGTSLGTDEHMLLTETGLSLRHRQAINARIEHKRLIEAACSVLQTYQKFLGNTAVLSRVPSQ